MDYIDKYLEEQSKEIKPVVEEIKRKYGIEGQFIPFSTTGTNTTVIPEKR